MRNVRFRQIRVFENISVTCVCVCGGGEMDAYQGTLPRRIWRIIIEPRTAFVAVVGHFAERFSATTTQHD